MGTTAEKLEKLLDTKSRMKVAIENQDVVVGDVPFDIYPDLIDSIKCTQYEESKYYLNVIKLTQNNGYVVEKIPIKSNDVIDLGEGVDVEASYGWGTSYFAESHPKMIFEYWSSPYELVDNKITIPDNLWTDITVGAIYSTIDGLTWLISKSRLNGYYPTSTSDASIDLSTIPEETYGIWMGNDVISTLNYLYEREEVLNVSLSKTLTNISNSAFEKSVNLRYIVIPKTVSLIPTDCFRECSSLSNIAIHSDLNEIKDNAFLLCSMLNSFPTDKVGTYGSTVFSQCGLKNIKIVGVIFARGTFTSNHLLQCIIMDRTGYLNDPGDIAVSPEGSYFIFLVPEDLVDTYKGTSGWGFFSEFVQADTIENRIKYGIYGDY